jgi:hypothetical protein
MKNKQIKQLAALVSHLTASVKYLAAISIFIAANASAQIQNEVKSTDLTEALKVFVGNMTAARASEQAAQSKASQLFDAAKIAATQLNDTNATPQTRFDAHAKVIELQSEAIRAKLQAARQSAKLLATAKDALHEVNKDLGNDMASDHQTLSSPADQDRVDNAIGHLDIPSDATISPESAEELRAARTYYEMASKGTAIGSAGSTALLTVARRLTAWEAHNRQAIVIYDAQLRRLQVAAVSGLAAVGNYTLGQALGPKGTLESTPLPQIAPLAPDISPGGETAASSPEKVNFRQVFEH